LRAVRGALVLLLLAGVCPAHAEDYAAARREMLRAIEQLTAQTALDTGRRSFDPRVLSVLGKVERHLFVPPGQQRYAYENRPLPIGHGQTMPASQSAPR
jgi:protein-L-isoaspartate(D-aspartate) O-methyltransferase